MSWKNDGIRCFLLLRLHCWLLAGCGQTKGDGASQGTLELSELKVTFFDVERETPSFWRRKRRRC